MKTLLILIFSLSSVIQIFAQDLPKYLTEEEKLLLKTYLPPTTKGITTPPPFPVRTMAEWEELRGVMITWTQFTYILSQIVDYAQDEGLVYIVTTNQATVENYLTNQGVPLTNLVFVNHSYNSLWCRDYGPWTVYKTKVDEMQIIDWIYNRPRPSDDIIPDAIGAEIGVPVYSTTTFPYNLTHTGGNFFTDGYGNGFSSKLVLNENPGKTEAEIDDIMNQFMGIDNFVKFDNLPYDGIHHIDMHMKLLDEETLLVGEYPEGESDGPQIEANLQYILNNFQTCYGRDFNVVRIPMPPDAQRKYPAQGGDYRTYTNSIIINKTVIVPTYEEQYDTTALRIYEEAMPGYNIIGINSNDIIPSLGAIHCITKEIGVEKPLLITHPNLRDTDETGPFEISAVISHVDGIVSADLYWTTDISLGYEMISFTQTTGDTFVVSLPQQIVGSEVFYYISAQANSGKILTKPITAPDGYIKFKVNDPVPVELESFTAEVRNTDVYLTWKTVTETNNRGFEIQRNSNFGEFETIEFIEGSGSTTEREYYSYVDKKLNSGNFTYRLCQIDFDGSKNYSNNVEVTVLPQTIQLEQNYPNPFNAGTKIVYTIPHREIVSLTVYDGLGREVIALVNDFQNAGEYIINWNGNNTIGSEAGSGIYFYTLSSGNIRITKKMILLR